AGRADDPDARRFDRRRRARLGGRGDLVTYALLALLAIPFVVVLARSVLVRRLATRHTTRRPVEALLVIAGSLLGTAIITGSFVVGDTITRSIRAVAYDQLGPVDETVTVPLAQGPALRARPAAPPT